MRIYQRARAWYIDYSFNGRRFRKKIGPSQQQAEIALREIGLKIAKGDTDDLEKLNYVLFDSLCKEYLFYSKANKAPQSYRRDQISIKNLLGVYTGKLITEVTAHELEMYKNRRRDVVKPATVNRELSCVKHMFVKAVDWDYLKENPLKSVKLFKEPPGRIRYLTEEEIKKLIDCCAYYIKPIVETALNTGMRKGEILNLKWSNVDTTNKVITITNSKNNESRGVPINDALLATLMKLENGTPKDSPVFRWENGMPIKSIKGGFNNAVNRAGISDFRFHDLRHTFASHLVMNGVDIRTVQQLLGHKTIAMTMRYSHISNEFMKAAVDKLRLTGYNDSVPKSGTKSGV